MKKVIKTTYEAFDGTVFENEDDCLEYEKMFSVPKGVVLLDENYKPINSTNDLEKVFFAYLPNKKAIEWFKERHKYEGLCCDFDFDTEYTAGYIQYNEHKGAWEDIDILICQLEEIRTNLDYADTDNDEEEEEEDEE